MGQKEKKTKKRNEIKQVVTSWKTERCPWDPDLPQQLVHLISLLPSPECDQLLDIGIRGVMKTMRLESSKCNSSNPTPPWLQLRLDDIDNDKSAVKGWFPRSQRYLYSDYLWVWKSKNPCLIAFLSDSPKDLNTEWFMLVLTGLTHPAFAYYKKCEHRASISTCSYCGRGEIQGRWIKEDCTIVDPHCSNPFDQRHFMRFTNGIAFKGKFYVLSSQGTVAVIERIDDSHLGITAVSKKRALPSISSIHFRECLLQSNGKILLVFLISLKYLGTVDDVEVFWLDIEKLVWNKMESIGDRTLFVGSNCCTSVIASQLGCPKNCVYFKQSTDDCGWWVYDLANRTICSSESYPVWAEPTLSLKGK